jgi:hypothetical protein
MNINKKQLQEALEVVKPGLANKEIIEQATSFAFLRGRVVTYNDEISISHPLKGLNIEGAIEADKLYKFLSKVTKEDVDVEIKNNELLLVSGRAKAGLTLMSEVKLPLEEVSNVGTWYGLPKEFVRLMKFAMTSCSTNMSKPVLTCVNVASSGLISASDNYRLIRCDMKEEMPTKTLLIPARSVMEMVKVNPTQVAEGVGWVHFQNEEGTIFSCRILEDKYPDLDTYLNVSGVRIVLPKTINEVLDRASVFAKREHILDEWVKLTIESNRLKIRSEAEVGWFEEETNMKFEHEKVEFSVTPYLLREIISETLAFVLNDDKGRLKFEGEGWIYVSLLKK